MERWKEKEREENGKSGKRKRNLIEIPKVFLNFMTEEVRIGSTKQTPKSQSLI